jgi:hypothetical protein
MKRLLTLLILAAATSLSGLAQNPLENIWCAPNEILYTTKNGHPLQDFKTDGFGGEFVLNIYKGGVGRLIFRDLSQIPKSAFEGCYSLTHITLPNSITSIGEEAFVHCANLENLTIPISVAEIGDRAFAWCKKLKCVNIPDSVTSIGDSAFYGCSSLTNIIIPDSITKVGHFAFAHCTSLTSVTIHNNINTIGGWAFLGCVSLSEFKGKLSSDDGRCIVYNGELIIFAPA